MDTAPADLVILKENKREQYEYHQRNREYG